MFTGSIRAVMTGVAVTVILISVLAASRLIREQAVDDKQEIVEIETLINPEEEPPLEELEDEPQEEEVVEDITPPIPALDLMISPELDAPALPISSVKFNPTMSVDIMAIDRAPAPLPVKKVVRKIAPKKVKPKAKAKPKYKPKPTPKPTPKPKYKPPTLKSYYQPSELDGRPREIRQGSFTWPSRAKGTSGTVSLYIEISSSGRVTVLSVRSSTDPALSEAAKKLARSSRYTAPKKNGKAVKARFSKTYKLIKPR